MDALDNLVALFSKLPGVGKKSATRMAYYVLDADESYAPRLADAVVHLRSSIRRCSVCGSYTEEDPCRICSDPSRDGSVICVVERPQDVRVIEEAREYRGLFHVLGGVIAPLEGMGPDDLDIAGLLSRSRNGSVEEVILAMNPTVEGDTTALYLQRVLKDTGLRVSRLASGLPVGGDLEYADRLTLSRSFRGRTRLS